MPTSWLDLLRWTWSSATVFGVDRISPCRLANSCQLLCPVSTAPVRGSTPTACQLLSPTNSLSRPLTTSGYGEISGPKILCLVSRQKQTKELSAWRATYVVLQTSWPHCCKSIHVVMSSEEKCDYVWEKMRWLEERWMVNNILFTQVQAGYLLWLLDVMICPAYLGLQVDS